MRPRLPTLVLASAPALVSALALALVAPLAASAAPADNAPSEGARLAFEGADGIAACSSCHALNGRGNVQAKGPALAGLHAAYLSKQLRDYREGTRVHESMDPIAKVITDAQIAALSDHYAAMSSAPASKDPASPEAMALGEGLARRGAWEREIPACEQCHAPGGMGFGPHFPRLAGQHAFYLQGQLEAWRSGVRKNDPNALMKTIAERLTAEELAAVAAYYATLDPNVAPERASEEGPPASEDPPAASVAEEGQP